jgi:hypothetical protein
MVMEIMTTGGLTDGLHQWLFEQQSWNGSGEGPVAAEEHPVTFRTFIARTRLQIELRIETRQKLPFTRVWRRWLPEEAWESGEGPLKFRAKAPRFLKMK